MDTSKHPAAALREKITAGLRARGHSNADIDHLPVTVEIWRRIARAAARGLGRPVQTLLVGESAVTAVLRDWPATPEERAVHESSMRPAIGQLTSALTPTKSGR